MDLAFLQPVHLRFRLLSAADGITPMDAVVWSSMTCQFARSVSPFTFQKHTLYSIDAWNMGLGFYEVWFPAAAVDTLGPLTSYLTAPEAIASWREDLVTNAATTWQGNLVRFVVGVSGVPVEACHVQVRDSAGTYILAQGVTDTDGVCVAMLVAGTYQVYAWSPGYSFAVWPKTVTITAAQLEILEATVFSPSNPGGPDVTTVNGWLLDATGAARAGVAVSFTPILDDEINVTEREALRPLASTSTSKLIARLPIVVTTDAAGAFSVSLTPNSDITPAGSRYLVAFSDTVADVALITVGATTPVNIEDLLPTA